MTKPNKSNGLSPLQRIQRAFVWAMGNPNFVAMSGVMMVGSTTIITDEKDYPSPMKTAYTDGLNVRFWGAFVDELDDKELRFALLHENYHKAFRHLTTWKALFQENAQLANIACDLRINADILSHNDAGIAMPKGGLFDQKYADPMKWSSYHIFQDLKKNGLPQSMKCQGNCQQGQGDGQGGGQPCTCQGFDEHGWQEANGMTQEELREAEQAIDSAIRQGAILAGKMAGNVDRSIQDLLAVKTNWKDLLREFMTTNVKGGDESSWSRPNRRYVAQDVYMPTQISDSMGDVLIGIDTSGSIGGPELTAFISNVARILQSVKPENVRVLYWDSGVAGDETYRPDQYDQLANLTKPRGGGGTSPSCVTTYMKKHKIKPQVAIMLSDGYTGGDFGDNWGCPVLWALNTETPFDPPAGQTVCRLPENLSDY